MLWAALSAGLTAQVLPVDGDPRPSAPALDVPSRMPGVPGAKAAGGADGAEPRPILEGAAPTPRVVVILSCARGMGLSLKAAPTGAPKSPAPNSPAGGAAPPRTRMELAERELGSFLAYLDAGTELVLILLAERAEVWAPPVPAATPASAEAPAPSPRVRDLGGAGAGNGLAEFAFTLDDAHRAWALEFVASQAERQVEASAQAALIALERATNLEGVTQVFVLAESFGGLDLTASPSAPPAGAEPAARSFSLLDRLARMPERTRPVFNVLSLGELESQADIVLRQLARASGGIYLHRE